MLLAVITGVWSRSHWAPSSVWWGGEECWGPRSTTGGPRPIGSNPEVSNSANRKRRESRPLGSCSAAGSCTWSGDRRTAPDTSPCRRRSWPAWRSGPASCSPGRFSRSGRSRAPLEEAVLGRGSRREVEVVEVEVTWLGGGRLLLKQDHQSCARPNLNWPGGNGLASIWCHTWHSLRSKAQLWRLRCLSWRGRGAPPGTAGHKSATASKSLLGNFLLSL